ASRHFVLAYGRHVVFGLACHNAGVTSDTPAEIDRHAPGVIDVFVRRVHRLIRFGRVSFVSDQARVFRVLIDGHVAHHVAPFGNVVITRRNQLVFFATLVNAAAGGVPWIGGR